MKTALLREKPARSVYARPKAIITMALPFYRSKCGTLVHRVRSGSLHGPLTDRNGAEVHHIAFHLWCGQTGFLGGAANKGELFDQSPENAIHCATCEGRAVGAGMCGARAINGRHVLYNARI